MGASILQRASFFKVMLGDFSSNLQIPTDFKSYAGENLCGKSILRSSKGRWYVKLERFGVCFFFQDGWESFVTDNGVSPQDLLVFFYDGESGFDVKIYGISGCEKEKSLPTAKVKEEPGIINEDFSEGVPTDDPGEDLPTDSKKRKSGYVGSKNNLCFKVMRSMKAMEDESVLRAACSMETDHPHFVAPCNKTRSTQVTIPKDLVKYFDLAAKKSLILQDSLGKSWDVEVSIKSDGRVCLANGWSDFYKKRCLKDGDACVFEFVQSGSAINIHLFRVEEYTTKRIPESGKSAQSHAGLRAKEEKRISHVGLANIEKRTRAGLLANDEKLRILKKANSFQSRHPKFVALWRLCRLYSMPIPKKVVKEVGISSNLRATLYDPTGREWPVEVTYRTYGKVEIGVGWCNFSKGNNLSLGDAVVFEFVRGTEAVQVHIFRLREDNPPPDVAENCRTDPEQ